MPSKIKLLRIFQISNNQLVFLAVLFFSKPKGAIVSKILSVFSFWHTYPHSYCSVVRLINIFVYNCRIIGANHLEWPFSLAKFENWCLYSCFFSFIHDSGIDNLICIIIYRKYFIRISVFILDIEQRPSKTYWAPLIFSYKWSVCSLICKWL